MALASLRDTCTDILAGIQGQVVLVLVSVLEKGWGGVALGRASAQRYPQFGSEGWLVSGHTVLHTGTVR